MSHVYPREPLVGVGALVLEGDRILLVKRRYPPGRGRWSLPGGHLKLSEGVLEAARRELEEEAGVVGEPLGVVNVDDAIIYDENGRIKYRYVLVTVLLKMKGGTVKPASDAEEARFFSLDEALGLQLTDSTRGLIFKLKEGRLPVDSPCPVKVYTPKYDD